MSTLSSELPCSTYLFRPFASALTMRPSWLPGISRLMRSQWCLLRQNHLCSVLQVSGQVHRLFWRKHRVDVAGLGCARVKPAKLIFGRDVVQAQQNGRLCDVQGIPADNRGGLDVFVSHDSSYAKCNMDQPKRQLAVESTNPPIQDAA
jgi:hypothetical protein